MKSTAISPCQGMRGKSHFKFAFRLTQLSKYPDTKSMWPETRIRVSNISGGAIIDMKNDLLTSTYGGDHILLNRKVCVKCMGDASSSSSLPQVTSDPTTPSLESKIGI